jgi:hypothetical protein
LDHTVEESEAFGIHVAGNKIRKPHECLIRATGSHELIFTGVKALRNGSHLPTTQCACADFGDFAKQRNGGGGGREKYLY